MVDIGLLCRNHFYTYYISGTDIYVVMYIHIEPLTYILVDVALIFWELVVVSLSICHAAERTCFMVL
jgi:hypothetical protein